MVEFSRELGLRHGEGDEMFLVGHDNCLSFGSAAAATTRGKERREERLDSVS